MNLDLEKIKNIDLCWENCEVDTIYYGSLLGIMLGDKRESQHTYQEKVAYAVETFEIALKDDFYTLRSDLCQITINYIDGSFEHFFVVWGKNDCDWGSSSLQKVHKEGIYSSLTSNCEPTLLPAID